MTPNVTELDDILTLMIASGLSHLTFSDGKDSLSMRLGDAGESRLSTPDRPMTVAAPETISTVSMGRLAFAHPGRHDDALTEGHVVTSGQAIAYVIAGHAITAVVATKPGALGRRLRDDGDIVGYGTPVFEFIAAT